MDEIAEITGQKFEIDIISQAIKINVTILLFSQSYFEAKKGLNYWSL